MFNLKLDITCIILISFIGMAVGQEDTLNYEYFDVPDVELPVETFSMCYQETYPYLLSCEVENVGDLEKCTEDRIRAFISYNIQIPKEFQDCEGKLYVEFSVNNEGNVCELKVLNWFEGSFTKAPLDGAEKFPKFVPGTQRGRPVKIKYSVPVRLKIR